MDLSYENIDLTIYYIQIEKKYKLTFDKKMSRID